MGVEQMCGTGCACDSLALAPPGQLGNIFEDGWDWFSGAVSDFVDGPYFKAFVTNILPLIPGVGQLYGAYSAVIGPIATRMLQGESIDDAIYHTGAEAYGAFTGDNPSTDEEVKAKLQAEVTAELQRRSEAAATAAAIADCVRLHGNEYAPCYKLTGKSDSSSSFGIAPAPSSSKPPVMKVSSSLAALAKPLLKPSSLVMATAPNLATLAFATMNPPLAPSFAVGFTDPVNRAPSPEIAPSSDATIYVGLAALAAAAVGAGVFLWRRRQ